MSQSFHSGGNVRFAVSLERLRGELARYDKTMVRSVNGLVRLGSPLARFESVLVRPCVSIDCVDEKRLA